MNDALYLTGAALWLAFLGLLALCLAFLARELLISTRFLYRVYRAYGPAVIKSPLRFVWYDAWNPSPHLELYHSPARIAFGPRVYRRGPAYQIHDLPEEGAG